MEKRLALALVLCFVWIILYKTMFAPPPSPVPPVSPADGVQSPEPGRRVDDTASRDVSGKPAGGQSETAGTSDENVELPEDSGYEGTGDIGVRKIDIETTEYLAKLSNRGAVIEEIRFKHYFTSPDVLLEEDRQLDPANWLDILREVQQGTPSFSIREKMNARYELDTRCWECDKIQEDTGETSVVFTYKTTDGLIFRKRFTFADGAYHIGVKIDVENRNPTLDRMLDLQFDGPCGITDRKRASFTAGPMGVVYFYSGDGDIRKRDLKTVPAAKLLDMNDGYSWTRRGAAQLFFAGVANNYFALLLKPTAGKALNKVRFLALEDSEKADIQIRAFEEERGAPPVGSALQQILTDARDNVRSEFELRFKAPPPKQTVSQAFMFFAGPKSTDLMKQPGYEVFYELIEDSYGSMSWINKSLIWILRFFHSIFSNWGVAIICLTIVVKTLLFPLNRVQQVSMYGYSEKMKRLKPKLEEIKKKYKNNKKKFNEAQMKMMKEEGVRPPLMGCLLIFFQFPIFIGLFQILRTSVELRHSPFCLWIKDLSQPDALFPLPFTIPLIGSSDFNVLPILMTVAFYYQQKLMPKPDTSDPQAQQMQKIMRFMPIMFGLLFYGYASGLSLYWMTSNIISILEYRFIRKKFPVGGAAQNAKAA